MSANRDHEKVLELEDVGFYYTRRKGYFAKQKYWALQKVSFTLNRGQCLGVIGRNGAGKTTLLKLLAGIITADQGKLINHGFTTTMLSLQAGFIPYLTGRENVFLNGMYLGLRKQLIKAKIEEIKAFSGLADFFEMPISAYSSGMRARLGFSIAFQLDPDVMLIDEVLGVGDESFQKKSSEMMRQKLKSNKTAVLVSHNPTTVVQLCDKAVWIEGGVSLAEGEPQTVIEQYQKVLFKQRK